MMGRFRIVPPTPSSSDLATARRHLRGYISVFGDWLADPERSDHEALESGRRLVHGLATALDDVSSATDQNAAA